MAMTGQIPTLRRWHVPVLRAVVARPGITAAEVGRMYWRTSKSAMRREWIAVHELLELQAMGLVQRDAIPGGRWSPALFAGEALAAAESRP
jgi:hypothetical protein